MNSEVNQSLNIFKVINRHLEELNCPHTIKSIMSEALNENAGLPAQRNADEPIPAPTRNVHQ